MTLHEADQAHAAPIRYRSNVRLLRIEHFPFTGPPPGLEAAVANRLQTGRECLTTRRPELLSAK